MMKRLLLALALVAFPGFAHANYVSFQATSSNLSALGWTNLSVGGGGNIIGQSVQPGTGIRLARGDVFGAYIWNTTTGKWSQLLTTASMPSANFGYFPATNTSQNQVFEGVASPMEIQGCYSTSTCAYLYYNGLIFYSSNISASNPSAITWCNTGGFTQTIDTSNAPGRGPGPYMAVDPANSAHVIVGTPSTGLFETFNGTSCGSATWAAIPTSSIPLGTSSGSPAYVMSFDPTSGTQTCHTGSGICTSVMYIFSAGGTSLYKTSNAGTSWSPTSGGPTTAHNIKVSAATAGGGNVWVDDASANDWILVGSTWTEVISGTGGPIAINPLNGNQVAITNANGNAILASTNGSTAAATFTSYSNVLAGGDAPWNTAIWLARNALGNAGTIDFDPLNSGFLISAGAQAIWSATFPTTGSTVTRTVMVSGIEGLIFSQIQVGAQGKPSMGAQDEGGCQMNITSNVNQTTCFPVANLLNLSYGSGLSIPPGVSGWMAGKFSPDFNGGADYSGYSTDGFGNSYLPFNLWNAAPAPANFANNGAGLVRISSITTTGLTTWASGAGSIVCTLSSQTALNGFSNRCYGATVINSTTLDLQGSTWDSSLNASGNSFILYVPATALSSWNGAMTIVNITNSSGLIEVTTGFGSGLLVNQQIVCISGVVMTGASVVNGCWSIGNVSGVTFTLGPASTFVGGDSYSTGGVATIWQPPGGNIAAGSTSNWVMAPADRTYPQCTANSGLTYSQVNIAGIPVAATTVTGGPYSAGVSSITVANGSLLSTLNELFIPLTSGRTFQDVPTVSGNTITFTHPIPPGDSIANGAAVSNSTGWPFAAFLNARQVAPDGAAPNTFFAMNTDMGLVKWTNCGSTTIVANDSGHASFLQFAGDNNILKQVPGQAGHLFWILGEQGSPGASHPASASLWRTCNGVNNTANSVTLGAVTGFFEPQAVGFGAAKPGSSYPAIYVVGWYSATNSASNAVYGVWKSTDDANNGATGAGAGGNTWTNIGVSANGAPNGFPLGWLSPANDLEGDPFVYGPVYYGGQFGAFYAVFNYLLKRDIAPASNDNDPVGINKAA